MVRWRERVRREIGGGGGGGGWQQPPFVVLPAAGCYYRRQLLVGDVKVVSVILMFLLFLVLGGGVRERMVCHVGVFLFVFLCFWDVGNVEREVMMVFCHKLELDSKNRGCMEIVWVCYDNFGDDIGLGDLLS